MRRFVSVVFITIAVGVGFGASAQTRAVSASPGDDSPRGTVERIFRQLRTFIKTLVPLDEINPPHP